MLPVLVQSGKRLMLALWLVGVLYGWVIGTVIASDYPVVFDFRDFLVIIELDRLREYGKFSSLIPAYIAFMALSGLLGFAIALSVSTIAWRHDES